MPCPYLWGIPFTLLKHIHSHTEQCTEMSRYGTDGASYKWLPMLSLSMVFTFTWHSRVGDPEHTGVDDQ